MSQYPALPKGSYNPGWNDPPKFEYGSTPPLPSAAKPKLNLNKRVAFPMQNNTTGQPVTGSSNAPPLPNVAKSGAGLPLPFAVQQPSIPSAVPLLVPTSSDSESTKPLEPPPATLPPPQTTLPQSIPSNDGATTTFTPTSEPPPYEFDLNSSEAWDYVKQELQSILDRLNNDPNKTEIIQKRLEMMHEMWSNDNLSDSVKDKLVRIAKALETGNTNNANELYRSLVVDNGQVCFQWGSALRQLILMKEQSIESAPVSNDIKEGQVDGAAVGSYFVPTYDTESNIDPNVSPTTKKSTGKIIHL